MRSLRRDKRGISPIVATILLIAVTAVAAGVIAAYVAGLYVGGATIPITATTAGTLIDWDTDIVDNYYNAKAIVEVTILTDDIDDVLDSRGMLSVTLTHHTRGWTTGAISMSGMGYNTANYGSSLQIDAVLDIAGCDNNLYVKMSFPTTQGGEITKGMTIRIDMVPCENGILDWDKNIDIPVFVGENGTMSPGITLPYWDERETIDISIVGRVDALTLSGFDGAYFFGTTTT